MIPLIRTISYEELQLIVTIIVELNQNICNKFNSTSFIVNG